MIIFFLFRRHFFALTEWLDEKKNIAMEKKAERKLQQIRDLVKLKEKLN